MKQKNIFCTYGCLSTLHYIKGGRKGQKLRINTYVSTNHVLKMVRFELIW